MNTETKKDALAKVSPEVGIQVTDIQSLQALAGDLLASGLFPAVKNVQGAVTVIQAGLELGIPPVAALNTMVIINGRLAMEAKALLAVAQRRAGVTWRVTKEGEKGCEIIFSRPGWPDTPSTFTEEEAKAAGLLGKTNWKLWAKDMYFARAAGRGIRRIAPDAILGLCTKEEMIDSPTNTNGPAIAEIAVVEKYPGVKPAEVHAPAAVKDEFSEPVKPLPADLSPAEAEATMEPDPPAGRSSLADLEVFAKSIADLKALGFGEAQIYGAVKKTVGREFAEPSELDAEEMKGTIVFLQNWKRDREMKLADKKAVKK